MERECLQQVDAFQEDGHKLLDFCRLILDMESAVSQKYLV